MKIHLILGCLATALLGGGCAYPSINRARPESYPLMPAKRLDPAAYAAAISTNGQSWHGVRMVPAKEHPDVTLAHKLDPVWWLRNSDDPVPPASYRPNKETRKVTWFFRNFGHNFTFYVIGKADKVTARAGWYPPQNARPGGGLDFQVTEWGYLRYPFVSWKTRWLYFYLGTRERGNVGAELHFGRQKDIDRPKKSVAYAPLP